MKDQPERDHIRRRSLDEVSSGWDDLETTGSDEKEAEDRARRQTPHDRMRRRPDHDRDEGDQP